VLQKCFLHVSFIGYSCCYVKADFADAVRLAGCRKQKAAARRKSARAAASEKIIL
jgi:hypothetical protein